MAEGSAKCVATEGVSGDIVRNLTNIKGFLWRPTRS